MKFTEFPMAVISRTRGDLGSPIASHALGAYARRAPCCLAKGGFAVSRDWVRVALVMAGVAWGANHFAPLLLVYRSQDHLSDAAVTATFGVYAVSLIPAVLGAGAYSQRHGRRATVRLGALLSLVATLVMVLASVHPGALYAGRLLAGPASGMTFTAGSAWITVG